MTYYPYFCRKIIVFTHLLSYNIYREVPENDWVILIILSSIFVFVFSFSYLHRGGTLVNYLRQEMTVSANNFLSWMISSAVFAVLLSTLISQYIPTLPEVIEKNAIGGFTLNKFGYTLAVLTAYYLFKTIFTYIFFQSVGAGKCWPRFYFVAGKFYLIYALVLMVMCVVHYYFSIDTVIIFPYYVLAGLIIWVGKIFYYIFQHPAVLPKEWYYKILYICTLQIAQVLVVYKSLF